MFSSTLSIAGSPGRRHPARVLPKTGVRAGLLPEPRPAPVRQTAVRAALSGNPGGDGQAHARTHPGEVHPPGEPHREAAVKE